MDIEEIRQWVKEECTPQTATVYDVISHFNLLFQEIDRLREENEGLKKRNKKLDNLLLREVNIREDMINVLHGEEVSDFAQSFAGVQECINVMGQLQSARDYASQVAKACAEIAESHQPQEFTDGCGTGKFIARTIRARFGREERG